MWWRKTKPRLDPDAFGELVERVTALEKSFRGLDAEWSEMYDKFRRLHMRLSKRDQRAQDGPEQPNGDPGHLPLEQMSLAARRLLGRL